MVVCSGGCYPSLAMASSNIFSLPWFSAGLTSFEMENLSSIRVIATVLSENLPMMFVQITYPLATSEFTTTVAISLVSSVLSVISLLLGWYINHGKSGDSEDVCYYYQIKLKQRGSRLRLTDEHILAIKNRMNVRLILRRLITKHAYTDVNLDNYLISHVFIRKDSFVIRIIHHVNREELLERLQSIQIDTLERETSDYRRAREEERLKAFQKDCHDMFLRSQSTLARILFEHFNCYEEVASRQLLRRNDFDLRYFKSYPKERITDQMMEKSNRDSNLDQFLSIQSVVDSRKKKKAAELRDGGASAVLVRYREQLLEGYQLVKDEVVKQRKGKKKVLRGTAQMENCVKLLVEHEIDRVAIQSILNLAYEFDLFGDGDFIGHGRRGTSAGEDRYRESMDEMMPNLDVEPEWFRKYSLSRFDRTESSAVSDHRHFAKRIGSKTTRKVKRKKKGKDTLPSSSELGLKQGVSSMENVPIGFWIDPKTKRRITFEAQYVHRVSDSEEEKQRV